MTAAAPKARAGAGTGPLRVAISELRYWCPEEKFHYPLDYGVECPGYHDGLNVRHRKRRMLVCDKCEQGYFNQGDFDGHECFSAYAPVPAAAHRAGL